MTLIRSQRLPRVVYLGASAGLGRIYDVAILMVARLRRTQVVIHHHSYRYINARDFLEAVVVRAAGGDALHILLCEHMRARYCQQYAVDHRRTTVLSSVMLAEREIRAMGGRLRGRVGAVGYLGPLSAEKGIWDFLALVTTLRAGSPHLLVHIAGPSADAAATAAVVQLATRDPLTRYWGAAYRADKVRFLDCVDVLIFPSRYRHEAEPLVVYEALAAGIPVIATQVGCVRALEAASGVFVLAGTADFPAKAADVVAGWLRDPAAYAAASAAARQHFVNHLELSDDEAARLLARLAAGEIFKGL
jgi:glycosyltransferase involved in cell wall biosynthesis